MPIGTGGVTPPQPLSSEGPVVAIAAETKDGLKIVAARHVIEEKIVFYGVAPDGSTMALPVSADDPVKALAYATQKSLGAWRAHPLPALPAVTEE